MIVKIILDPPFPDFDLHRVSNNVRSRSKHFPLSSTVSAWMTKPVPAPLQLWKNPLSIFISLQAREVCRSVTQAVTQAEFLRTTQDLKLQVVAIWPGFPSPSISVSLSLSPPTAFRPPPSDRLQEGAHWCCTDAAGLQNKPNANLYIIDGGRVPVFQFHVPTFSFYSSVCFVGQWAFSNLVQISSYITFYKRIFHNSFEIMVRCQACLLWNHLPPFLRLRCGLYQDESPWHTDLYLFYWLLLSQTIILSLPCSLYWFSS